MADSFDVVVVGAGSDGYARALRGAELGLSVALVERGKLGAACRHVGCMPAKALLHAAEDVGVHIIGARAGELVGEAQPIGNWEAHPEDVAPLVHAHPTRTEALGEAHLALAGRPLHAHS